jgi:hypothetical protein
MRMVQTWACNIRAATRNTNNQIVSILILFLFQRQMEKIGFGIGLLLPFRLCPNIGGNILPGIKALHLPEGPSIRSRLSGDPQQGYQVHRQKEAGSRGFQTPWKSTRRFPPAPSCFHFLFRPKPYLQNDLLLFPGERESCRPLPTLPVAPGEVMFRKRWGFARRHPTSVGWHAETTRSHRCSNSTKDYVTSFSKKERGLGISGKT